MHGFSEESTEFRSTVLHTHVPERHQIHKIKALQPQDSTLTLAIAEGNGSYCYYFLYKF